MSKTSKNYFPTPNKIFSLGLSPGEFAVYSYLLRCADRRTHQCWPSYKTIGEATKMSVNTVRKHVCSLADKGLINTEDTDAPEDTLRNFIESSSEADALLKKLLHSQRREQIEIIFANAVRSYLQEVLNRQESKPDLSLADAKVMLDFCTYGIVGLLLENCGKKSLDKEKMVRQMQRLIFDRIDMQNEKD